MKKLNQYISEKLIVNNTIQGYNYYPKTKDDLVDCIEEKIRIDGYGTKDNPLNLNDIDTSKITDMSYLFDGKYVTWHIGKLSNNGHFDISAWDTSNVTNMKYMFYKSNFNGDLSNWDVYNVENMDQMFYGSPLQKNPPKWYKK